MRHAIRTLALLIASVLPAPAQAQFTVTPFAGVSVAGQTSFVDLEQTAGDLKAVYGATVGWRMTRRWTLGFEGALMPQFLKGDGELVERGRLTSLLASVDYAFWPRSSSAGLQLFLTGGAGAVRVEIDDVLGAFTGSSALPAGHVGAGVLFPLRSRIRVRSDVRYVRSTFEPGGRAAFDEEHVSFWRVTSGVAIEF
jgi:Outer membrane protein beta-barrel domain